MHDEIHNDSVYVDLANVLLFQISTCFLYVHGPLKDPKGDFHPIPLGYIRIKYVKFPLEQKTHLAEADASNHASCGLCHLEAVVGVACGHVAAAVTASVFLNEPALIRNPRFISVISWNHQESFYHNHNHDHQAGSS